MLRDVLGFHATEVADMLDSSVDSVKGALKRARATLERGLPPADRDRAPLPNSPGERELVRRFADAFEADDINGIVTLLTEDAWLTMPPDHARVPGPIADRLVPGRRERHLAPRPALPAGTYAREHATGVRLLPHRPTRADRPRHRTGRADPRRRTDRRDHAVLDPSILSRFGLPRTLRGEG